MYFNLESRLSVTGNIVHIIIRKASGFHMYTLAYHSEHYSITRVFKEKTSAPHYVITGSQPVHNHICSSVRTARL